MTSGIDGLISGLDTTSLINQLMAVEANPQTLLKTKSTTAQSLVTALQTLNVKVASLATSATKAAAATSWSAWTATSSASSVTASASSKAQAGSLSFTVDAVAASQVSLTAPVPDNGTLIANVPPSITVRKADGTLVTVTPTSGTLSDIATAFNQSAACGVTATVVRVSGGEIPTYRIQFTGTSTGAANTFEVYAGTETAVRLDDDVVRSAADSRLILWEGSAVEKEYTQASNTFSDLMTGVDVTVSPVTSLGSSVTVTVAQDGAALAGLASDLVNSLGVVLSEISSRTALTTTTDDSGTVVKGGLFSGDSGVRGIRDRLVEALSYPVDGFSPSEVGITFKEDGTFAFDADVFAQALAADPAKVQSMVTGIADRVAAAATAVSDPYVGTLTMKITGQESLVKDYTEQIANWDRRLAMRKSALQTTYAALEVTLSNLKSQSDWLTSQLDALTTSSSSSSSSS